MKELEGNPKGKAKRPDLSTKLFTECSDFLAFWFGAQANEVGSRTNRPPVGGDKNT